MSKPTPYLWDDPCDDIVENVHIWIRYWEVRKSINTEQTT
jgi:hypothetical protein